MSSSCIFQKKQKRLREHFLTVLAIVTSGLLLSPALAFDNDQYTQTEKVGFAFYKLGNIKPDFTAWIKKSKRYQETATPRERLEMMNSEKYRLEQGFATYYPEFGEIEIETPIYIMGMPKEDLLELEPDENRFITISTLFEGGDFYFPYPVGHQWITLLPRKIGNFDTIPVPAALYKQIKSGKTELNSRNEPVKGTMELILQPVSVNTEAPVPFEDVETWLMNTEIAAMSLWVGKKNMLLWEYTAPWYVSDTQQGLQHLYGD